MKLGETKLICWPIGPNDSILGKNEEKILQHFEQLFFLIYCFLRFDKKKEIKHKNFI